MDHQQSKKGLIISIITAAVLVSGSLVFLGIQMTNKPEFDDAYLSKKIEEGIEAFVEKQRQAQLKAQADQVSQKASNIKTVRKVTKGRDHIFGNPNAVVSIVEYSDFECPFCKRFHTTPKKLVKIFGDKVNWIYRHFPLDFHNPVAQKEAEASECVASLGGNDQFWNYTDKIYEKTRSNGKGVPENGMITIATGLGIDKQKLLDCINSKSFENRVMEDYIEGIQIGIKGTPGVILLNNQSGEVEYKAGAYPIDVYVKLIEKLL